MELTSSGTFIQNITLSSFSLIGCSASSCTSNTLPQGFLTRSYDGRYLLVAGYGVPPATNTDAILSQSSTITRCVARIHYSSSVDMTTAFIGFRSTVGSIRSAISLDGSGFWLAGYNDPATLDGGIRYAAFGSNISSAMDTYVSNPMSSYKFGTISNNNGYWSDQYTGWNYIGRMEPLNTTAQNIGGASLLLNGDSHPSNIMGFVFVQDGTLLFACDYGVGLRKYSSSSRPYSGFIENTTNSPTFYLPIADSKNVFGIDTAAGSTILYISTPSTAYSYNYLTSIWTPLVFAAANYEFRGIAMAPSSATATSSRTMTATSSSSISATASSSITSTPTQTSAATSSQTATRTTTATSSQTATSSVTARPAVLKFYSSDGPFSVLVPANIVKAEVMLWGGGGGALSIVGGNGGAGAFVTGTLSVVPGEILTVLVGTGGTTTATLASGGGRSAIQRSSVDIVSAGGGGGGAGGIRNGSRTSSYGGGGGVSNGCEVNYEIFINGYISSMTTIGLGANQTHAGISSYSCMYSATGGDGYFAGGGSCYGGGGGSSYTELLADSIMSSSSCNGIAGRSNMYYKQGVGIGGSRIAPTGASGAVIINWLWSVPSMTGSAMATGSLTATYNTLTATKSSGASASPTTSVSPTSTLTAAVQQVVGSRHIVCATGPTTANEMQLECPSGSFFYSIDFATCGTYSGSCGNFRRDNCNLMPRRTIQLMQDACVGATNCSFTGAQLCEISPIGNAECDSRVLSYAVQGSCMPGVTMLQTEVNAAVTRARRGDITPATLLRYIRISSTMAISDGMMSFAELAVITNAGVNIALSGNASSSSVFQGGNGINDYDICGADSDIPSAGIDGSRCTFVAMNYDVWPWWELDLGYGVLLNTLSRLALYARPPFDDADGYSHDYSYQIDSAIVVLVDPDGNTIFANNLPWISVLPIPFIINITQVLAMLDEEGYISISATMPKHLANSVIFVCTFLTTFLW
jgi:hypothetical protein